VTQEVAHPKLQRQNTQNIFAEVKCWCMFTIYFCSKQTISWKNFNFQSQFFLNLVSPM